MHILERKRRESGRDYALRTLKENIIQLELEPGSMVSENELAAELGLSRTPVREALIELQKAKAIEIYPQRGSGISLVDFTLVDEAHFMRETLENAVLERCCQRGLTDAQVKKLEENLSLQDFYAKNRTMKLLELDNAFHALLFAAANLQNVFTLMNSMTIHLDRVRAMHLIAAKELKSVEEHHRIFEAVIRRDAETAKKWMRGHIGHYQQDEKIIRDKYPQYIR